LSSYIHTLGFKVLIDSEVIDFTFKVPRGTLLVQILDELGTTLQIQPQIIAVINHLGEIVVIENHYSTIDFLIQKYGTEFYTGEISVVTFNHGEYIVDLEIPEAMPFAATYRTACKSFVVSPQEVSIERQDGQIMDEEVFSRPTAFVLNSWGNFYRIVDKEFGDTIEDIFQPKPVAKPDIEEPEPIVFPPQLDQPITKPDVPVTESQIDTLTDNLLDRQISEEPEQPEDEFLTKPVEDDDKRLFRYPWDKETETAESTEEEIKSLRKLIDNLTLEDEILVGEQEPEESIVPETTSQPETPPPPIDQPSPPVDESVVKEVFSSIFAEEEIESSFREQAPEEEVEGEFSITKAEEAAADVLTFEDEVQEPSFEMEEEAFETYDLPTIPDEDEEIEVEGQIDALPEVEDEYIEIPHEPEETKTITEELREGLQELDLPSVDDTELSPPITNDTAISILDDALSLDERLEKRKQELTALETHLKSEEEKVTEKVSQRSLTVEYYERMYPQKIYPLVLHFPKVENNSEGKNTEITVQPIFPGCHITPAEQMLDLYCDQKSMIEFNITPLVKRGKIAGKVCLWHKKRNLISVVTASKVISSFWPYFTGILAFLIGLLPILLQFIAGTNDRLVTAIGFTANGWLGIEIALLVSLLSVSLGLTFGLRPRKQIKTRKFYPIIKKDE
jgi:hypothetical protein